MKPLSLLLCLALLTPVWGQELPDAPQPNKIDLASLDAGGRAEPSGYVPKLASGTTGASFKHHNWFYRHPILTGSIIGGGIALGWGLTHRDSCPSMVTGYPYNGYGHPCPTRCDSDGCYWPRK